MKHSKTNPSPTDTSSSYPIPAMKELFEAILRLKSPDEAARFFRDLLTIAELKEFANRWQAVKMLSQGTSYTVIAEKLGMSTATVTRVAHWFHHGMDGYKAVANRMKFRSKVK